MNFIKGSIFRGGLFCKFGLGDKIVASQKKVWGSIPGGDEKENDILLGFRTYDGIWGS